jgi:hypothetical protein
LLVINGLNGGLAGDLTVPPVPGNSPPFHLDVNGDNQLSAIDALLPINVINARLSPAEPEPPAVANIALVTQAAIDRVIADESDSAEVILPPIDLPSGERLLARTGRSVWHRQPQTTNRLAMRTIRRRSPIDRAIPAATTAGVPPSRPCAPVSALDEVFAELESSELEQSVIDLAVGRESFGVRRS